MSKESIKGHSKSTTKVHPLFQKCMFEHKYNMDCKQGNVAHLLSKIHISMYNQLSQALKKEAKSISMKHNA
jgi:hypothetical protein